MIQPSAEATTPREVAAVSAFRIARPNGWWGMVMLIATEASLFGVLIASFFYLRFKAVQWPPSGDTEPKLLVPILLTIMLVSTSVPMQLAVSAARRGRVGLARLGILVTLLVGGVYLGIQVHRVLVSLKTLKPSDDAYASIVYTLAVGHHAHVALGLLIDLYLAARLVRGLTSYRATGVEAAALYWHFVNVLAILVTATLLSPSV